MASIRRDIEPLLRKITEVKADGQRRLKRGFGVARDAGLVGR